MLLRQMKYFLAAVYCKSFNEAAKQCFISQPSFSLQIKQLEKELGVKLITAIIVISVLHRQAKNFTSLVNV